MAENKNMSGTIWGFIIGGVIGSIVALLYAPKPGKELRTDITKRTNEIIEDGKKKSVELWETTKTKAGSMIDSAGNLFISGKEKIVTEAEKMKGAIKAGADAYGEERAGNGNTNVNTGTGSSSRSHNKGSHSGS
jgi:gas vesicle protein